jgi:hypothetical protein
MESDEHVSDEHVRMSMSPPVTSSMSPPVTSSHSPPPSPSRLLPPAPLPSSCNLSGGLVQYVTSWTWALVMRTNSSTAHPNLNL